MNEKSTETPSLASLESQLEALKKTQKTAPQATPAGDAARGAIDFASAAAVGSTLGFGVDYLLHTLPWGLIAGLIIGVVAGFRMLLRVTLPKKKTIAEVDATSKPNE